MGRSTRRRPTGARRATFAAAALILGGGGLVAANVYASATEGGLGGDTQQSDANGGAGEGAWGPGTIDCPDVGDRLTAVPDPARAEVDKELALLDQQIADAYQRLQQSARAVQEDSGFADSAIMNPLKEKRTATIERIAIAIDRVGDRPEGLETLAACTLRDQTQDQDKNQDQDQDQGQGQGPDQNQDGNGGQAGNGPVVDDFADITTVQPNAPGPSPQADASRGTFTTRCGVNAEGLFNSDNVIVAPGVTNGAHHFHDYVGNQSNNAFASDDDLANADTSCQDDGDKSSYYWPVLRLQNGTQERDAGAPGGGTEGNAGEIVTPNEVTLTFVGNPRSQVTAMPRLLRIITGDAKAFVNGPANANASWSCTGFEDRQLKDKYPLCPDGSDVVRTFKFQSCWDGRNIDSANHRTHVAFATADGSCPEGFQAIPQLVQRIVYDVDAPSVQDGGRTTPLFAVDSFPEQLHKPVTDHGDFINVFDEGLMREMVDCINGGRQCGAGAAPGTGNGDGTGSGNGNGDQGQQTQAPEPTKGGDGGEEQPGDTGGDETSAPPTDTPSTDLTATATDPGEAQPKVYSSPSATARPKDASAQAGSDDKGGNLVTTAPDKTTASEQAQDTGESGQDTSAAAQTPPQTEPQTEPQAVQGGLAETGAQLWPAAVGAVLAVAGVVLLTRTRRRSM
ncbi:DUF1996 domain-containing protein [Streptomyces sp. NPDC002088]|uniref:DUF1996 domain-containing protein n=1 Tax=Streptomyces sp. NPDC002088 TaxID=3154665 RepID=UPI00333075D1